MIRRWINDEDPDGFHTILPVGLHRKRSHPAHRWSDDLRQHAQGDGECQGLIDIETFISGRAICRTRIRSASPDRLVFDTENTGTIRHLLMPILLPGGLLSTAGYKASSTNRSLEIYRYLAGVPTDKAPPAAP